MPECPNCPPGYDCERGIYFTPASPALPDSTNPQAATVTVEFPAVTQ
jgi:hypothetical protein